MWWTTGGLWGAPWRRAIDQFRDHGIFDTCRNFDSQMVFCFASIEEEGNRSWDRTCILKLNRSSRWVGSKHRDRQCTTDNLLNCVLLGGKLPLPLSQTNQCPLQDRVLSLVLLESVLCSLNYLFSSSVTSPTFVPFLSSYTVVHIVHWQSVLPLHACPKSTSCY